jgi:hypothetical protein
MALKVPRLGSFIAALDVPVDGAVSFEQNGADPDHYDLYGAAGDMLMLVRFVTPV